MRFFLFIFCCQRPVFGEKGCIWAEIVQRVPWEVKRENFGEKKKIQVGNFN